MSTNYHLAARKVSNNDRCGFCGECESLGHVLWDSKVAVEVWREVDIGLPRLNQPTRDFVDVVWAVMERKGDRDWVMFAITRGKFGTIGINSSMKEGVRSRKELLGRFMILA